MCFFQFDGPDHTHSQEKSKTGGSGFGWKTDLGNEPFGRPQKGRIETFPGRANRGRSKWKVTAACITESRIDETGRLLDLPPSESSEAAISQIKSISWSGRNRIGIQEGPGPERISS